MGGLGLGHATCGWTDMHYAYPRSAPCCCLSPPGPIYRCQSDLMRGPASLACCVASPSTDNKVAQELLGLMLDRLATDSSLNLLPAAVKLEGALQMLVKAVCMSFLDTPNAVACRYNASRCGLVMNCSHSLQCAFKHQTSFGHLHRLLLSHGVARSTERSKLSFCFL